MNTYVAFSMAWPLRKSNAIALLEGVCLEQFRFGGFEIPDADQGDPPVDMLPCDLGVGWCKNATIGTACQQGHKGDRFQRPE